VCVVHFGGVGRSLFEAAGRIVPDVLIVQFVTHPIGTKGYDAWDGREAPKGGDA
jgi:hypothetical protein